MKIITIGKPILGFRNTFGRMCGYCQGTGSSGYGNIDCGACGGEGTY